MLSRHLLDIHRYPPIISVICVPFLIHFFYPLKVFVKFKVGYIWGMIAWQCLIYLHSVDVFAKVLGQPTGEGPNANHDHIWISYLGTVLLFPSYKPFYRKRIGNLNISDWHWKVILSIAFRFKEFFFFQCWGRRTCSFHMSQWKWSSRLDQAAYG